MKCRWMKTSAANKHRQANSNRPYELGDCCIYIACLASDIGFSLNAIADMNLAKLEDRRDRNVPSVGLAIIGEISR